MATVRTTKTRIKSVEERIGATMRSYTKASPLMRDHLLTLADRAVGELLILRRKQPSMAGKLYD